ncbi:hypothetical protein C8R44DRAFT_871552 [Mycena epipterygia]|nr:hypothetical protein C8R44DRAFT_871552 [Mycena epipterygia]
MEINSVHGHSVHNKTNFGGDEWYATYGTPWAQFAESVIPRSQVHGGLNPVTVNDDGSVDFPSVDIDSIPLADLRQLLQVYFERCWVNKNSKDDISVTPVPWAEIGLEPSKFYDVQTFNFPLALKDPKTYTSRETLTIGEFLNGLNGSSSFHFKASVSLCPTICRVNHTCYSPKASPNAGYFWNVGTKEEELSALREIRAEQEIEVSYMNNPASEGEADPLTNLREKFGFDCSCSGCARPAAERRASQQRILAYKKFVDGLALRFALSRDPLRILAVIEAQILIICEEGYTGELCERAHDAFQLCAYYGDEASARKWEEVSRDHYILYPGPTSETVKMARRLAAKPQESEEWMRL